MLEPLEKAQIYFNSSCGGALIDVLIKVYIYLWHYIDPFVEKEVYENNVSIYLIWEWYDYEFRIDKIYSYNINLPFVTLEMVIGDETWFDPNVKLLCKVKKISFFNSQQSSFNFDVLTN